MLTYSFEKRYKGEGIELNLDGMLMPTASFSARVIRLKDSLKNDIKGLLESEGFDVELDATLEGRSGIKHKFDVVATKDNSLLCFEFCGNLEEAFLSVLAKALDVRGAKVFVLIKEKARELEEGGRLVFVQYVDRDDLLVRLQKLLSKEFPS